MKKALMVTTMFLSLAASAFEQLPEGSYAGHGRWKNSEGQSGSYKVSTVIKAGQLSSTYLHGTEEEKWEFTAQLDQNGFFNVVSKGRTVGRGYCQSVQCHYEVTLDKTRLEETLTFVEGKFYRVGSKGANGALVAWEEEQM